MANLNNFTRTGKHVPKVAELKPSSKYRMTELIEAGGIHPLMKEVLDRGLLLSNCLTVSGKTLTENPA